MPVWILGVLLVVAGAGLGFAAGIPLTNASGGSPTPPPAPAHLYLTVIINPENGMPQYSPANFTVPTGLVVVTINDTDSPMNWSGCLCRVRGTVNGVEYLNQTPYAILPPTNVAHTFSIPTLGLNVVSPGQSSVTFTLDLINPGQFIWFCMAPCGSDGPTGAPMGVPGYMTGTMTVIGR
ncbi:MAG: cupredoxin domain-containing protein [Thermoplasmata archaeon]